MKSMVLFVIVAFASIAQEEKKQRQQGAKLLVVLALSSVGLEKKKKKMMSLVCHCHGCGSSGKKIHDNELSSSSSWPSPLQL